jgi:Fe-S-cluster containining protein
MSEEQCSCKRCGKCCNEGGPTLHEQDLHLIRTGEIPLSALITLRKGELAHNPVLGRVAPIGVELVKLKGTGKEWNCCYFDVVESGCTIYTNRPQACKILKCWEPEGLLAIVEKNTLSRLDIMTAENPLRNLIGEHDKFFPCPDLEEIAALAPNLPEPKRRALQQLVNEDIRFRLRVVKEFELKLSDELFYFGRPLFQLLQPLGARVKETAVGLEISWK